MNRKFEGVWIDKNIWLNKKLNPTEKCLLKEIISLDQDKGCYATNQYFQDFLQCSKPTVSRTIKKLKELGYIKDVGYSGRRRILKSNIKC